MTNTFLYFCMPYVEVCSSGFVYIHAACYHLGSTAVTWYEANTTCNSLGTGVHLATISSATEQAAIVAYYGTSTNMWIGLNCIATHASYGTSGEVWVWADGSTSTYRNWNIVQPDNGIGGTEACVHLWPGYSGEWNDYDCSASTVYSLDFYGLCKYTPGV